MKFAVCLGSYRFTEFVALNIAQTREIFGDDVPILVSDDLSPESPQIKALAEKEGCSYVCPAARRSHFSGDWQAIINASHWASTLGCELALKLSLRLIPLHPEFREILVRQFENPKVGIAVPGRPQKHQFARPESAFYAGFGHLTDLVCFRPEALPPQLLIDSYRNLGSGPGKSRGDRLVEVCLGKVMANIASTWESRMVDELANHKMGQPRLYLRKAQSNRSEYVKLAEKFGIEGPFALQEWSLIERKDYLATAPIV